ncbi:hypothetical protein MIDIC_230126 [Alphaproteobacteria bacterium]
MRWAKAGVWEMIFNTLAVDEDNDKAPSACSWCEKSMGTGM